MASAVVGIGPRSGGWLALGEGSPSRFRHRSATRWGSVSRMVRAQAATVPKPAP